VPKNQNVPSVYRAGDNGSFVEVVFASHPIPDESSLRGVEKMFTCIEEAPEDALVIVLISGGGSALMEKPVESVSLEDIQATTKVLLECGASIDEINTIRKHLSAFKGGRLAEHIHPRRVITLLISDVINDRLDTIASGPTVPDATTFHDCQEILRRYKIAKKLPRAVGEHIDSGSADEIPDTPKADNPVFGRVTHHIIGNAAMALNTARKMLSSRRFRVHALEEPMQGEAAEYGARLFHMISEYETNSSSRVAFLNSGELTVTIRGGGTGGRNQEMLLGFLAEWEANREEIVFDDRRFLVFAGAFDGIEGNSPAMGACVDSSTLAKVDYLKMDIKKALKGNDSYSFFKELGQVVETGQTGTNVNDMLMVLIILATPR
jgi:glycerate-2-kinase